MHRSTKKCSAEVKCWFLSFQNCSDLLLKFTINNWIGPLQNVLFCFYIFKTILIKKLLVKVLLKPGNFSLRLSRRVVHPNFLLVPAGGPGGADRSVWAQHARVHHAAGSSAQNVPGRSHQTAAQPPEELQQHQQQQRGKSKHTVVQVLNWFLNWSQSSTTHFIRDLRAWSN